MPSRLKVALAAALGLAFVVTPAFPQPSPTTSDVPAGIILVGARDGVPDPHGEFEIVVRDAASNPVPFTTVRIDFSQCLDVWPSAVQPYPGVSMSCGTRIVTATTDADGRARMILMGSVLYRTPSSGWQCAQVRADPGNVVIGSVNAACADQDGIDGVDNRDVNRVLCDQQDADYDAPQAIAAGTELALFQLSINRQRTVQDLIGPPPCAGCSSPVLIKFRSVKILGGAGWSCETPVQGQSLASGHLSVFADRPGSTSHVFAQREITGVGDPVADAMGLWLEGAHPSRRALEIGFSLSSDAPARVEVVDAAGRRVEARDVDGTTGGRQRMTLGSAALLRPGVYWVRLTQGTEHRSIKAVCIP